jgi:response regulator RpfG family c-di-GMP phosphodiesterase
MERDDLRNLYYASALHDIGILKIGSKGLRSSGTVANNSLPESHAIIGAEMVKPVSLLARTEPVIRHHHEAWDGSGYPDGMSRDRIPLGARIVAVAEAYEETGLNREFIASNAGRLFDHNVVNAFSSMISDSVVSTG